MKKTCAAVLAISMAILWAGGCQEEQVSSDVKQSRLIAAENRDLKTQLQQETKRRDEEIKNLNSQMQTETKKRDDEIKNLKTEAKKQDEAISSLEKRLQTEKEKLNADADNLSKQLAKCVQERQAALDRVNMEIKKQSEEITEGAIIPLMKETGELKTEIARLKAELSDCERKK
jgi:exonuclease VII large subunit